MPARNSVANNSTMSPTSIITVAAGDPLPTTFPNDTAAAQIDVDASSGSVDLSSWAPTGLKDGAIVSLRKTDASANQIQYTDTVAGYNFVDQRGEFLTLMWIAASGTFRPI